MHNIENEFIKHFDSSAPDLLKKIQETPVVLISSEDELFSEINRIETKKDSKPLKIDFKWCSIAAAMVAIFICAIIFFPKSTSTPQIAGNIIIDCNPSINIEVTDDLKVNSFYAVNDDGAEILEKINISNTIDDIVEQVVYYLKNDGYLDSDSNNILVSYCYKNNAEKSNQIKKLIERKLADDDVEIIYQSFKEDDSVTKKAGNNKVSVGKYVYIQKVNRDKNIDKEKLYDMNINHIAESVKKDNPEATFETKVSSKDNSENEISATKPTVATEPTDSTRNSISKANKGKNEAYQNENATANKNENSNSTKATQNTVKNTVDNTNSSKGNSNNNSNNTNANSNKNEKATTPSRNKDKHKNQNTIPFDPKATNPDKNNGKSKEHQNTNKNVRGSQPIDIVH